MVTRDLARVCIGLRFNEIPKEVVDKTRMHILDTLGAMIAGSLKMSSRSLMQAIIPMGGRADSTVVGTMAKVPVINAALVNGEMAHDRGLDDVDTEASVHPGATVIPAALAMGEMLGVDGKTLIEAIVVGYEAMVRIGRAIGPAKLYERGLHPSGISGPFGSAAAAGHLLRLDEIGMARAFGIAGSQSGGLAECLRDGSAVKCFHVGRASQSGVLACLLAQEGYTAPLTVIEGTKGILTAYADEGSQAVLSCIISGLGKEFVISKTSLKLYSCTRYNEPPVNCALELRKRHGISPEDVDEVTVEIFEAAIPIIAEPIRSKRKPQTSLEAQLSLPYSVAVALVKGRAFVDEYTEDAIRESKVLEMAERVHVRHAPDLDAAYPRLWPARVAVRLNDGRLFSTAVRTARGDIDSPLTWDEVEDKFTKLASRVFSMRKVKRISEEVKAIESVRDLRDFSALLRPDTT